MQFSVLINYVKFICRPLRYERVYLPLCEVADTPFPIQGDFHYLIESFTGYRKIPQRSWTGRYISKLSNLPTTYNANWGLSLYAFNIYSNVR